MRFVLLICFLIIQYSNAVETKNGFFTVFAPKKVYEKRPYNVVVEPKNIDENVEIALQFRKAYGSILISNNDNLQIIKMANTISSGKKSHFELFVTLHRYVTRAGRKEEQCKTQTLQNIESIKKMFYTFIQLDKPIYKPGDLIQFRIIVVDTDLKPFHYNSINVSFIDPLNRLIKVFDDPGEMYFGIFTNSFRLSSSTPIGTWKIRAEIDKLSHFYTNKTFAVEKYTLPPFDVHLSTPETDYLNDTQIKFTFYGKYSFGDYVRGSASLVIRDNHGNIYHRQVYENIANKFSVELRINENLHIHTTDKLELEAIVQFRESQGLIEVNKTIKFCIHVNKNFIIRPVHPSTFRPGLPFHVKVYTYEWNDKPIMQSIERVFIKFNYTLENDDTIRSDHNNAEIRDGVAMYNFITPENMNSLKIYVNFVTLAYEQDIKLGNASLEVSKIFVDHYPLAPEVDKNVTIFVRSDTEIDYMIILIMSRHGNVESHKVVCYYSLTCKLETKITSQMMPEATAVVYQVNNNTIIFTGKTVIRTANIGRNFLDLTLPRSAKTKEKIEIKFTTKEGSTVYLLAFDKRLTYLRDGNDVKRDDVVETLAGYDAYNNKEVLSLDGWDDCTNEELDRIENGRKYLTVDIRHTGKGDVFDANERKDFGSEEYDEEKFDQEESPEFKPEAGDDLREYFPETWLVKEITMTNETMTVKVPDSITSWIFSAFAMNNETGLAIAPTKELIVKNEFFMKIFLPYSIRFKEILRLDIYVYNYINNGKSLEVNVTLKNDNQFQFVQYNGCDVTYYSAVYSSQTVTVPHNDVRKVSFYIKSRTDKAEYEQRIIIFTKAVGVDNDNQEYVDTMRTFLSVEPIGVKIYDIETKNKKLVKTLKPIEVINQANLTKYEESHPRFSVAISSDYLSESLNISTNFELFPSGCLEQKTSKVKANVAFFQRIWRKNKTLKPSDLFNNYYQSLLNERRSGKWDYANAAGYRAYFVDTIGSAMNASALPMKENLLEVELDVLRTLQNRNGTFRNFGSVPPSKDRNGNHLKYFQTAYILHVFLKSKKIVGGKYDDVIQRSFNFLNSDSNRLLAGKRELSIAAYAYALAGQKDTARMLLKEVEKESLIINKSVENPQMKCYKSSSDSDCDIVHSSYALLAYLKLHESKFVEPVFMWLIDSYNKNKYSLNTYLFAIATEAIAKKTKKQSEETDFTVTLENEDTFRKTIHVTNENMNDVFEVEFPKFSKKAKIYASGQGFCSITTIIEKTVTVRKTKTMFTLNVTPLSQTMLEVCAIYDPRDIINSLESLNNVIYDVEMPSGYIFSEVVDFEKIKEIKMVSPRQLSTRVQIYYNDFKQGIEYCVKIKIKQLSVVRNVEQTGLMVYYYEEKENVAVEFYKFQFDECQREIITEAPPTTTARTTTLKYFNSGRTRRTTPQNYY